MPAPSDLVYQTSTSSGTGNLTLTTVNGKRSFNTAFGNGATTNVFDYFISSQGAAEWERGTGHMSTSTTLVRDTVIASSNANAAVNFTAGNTLDVTNDIPADKRLLVDAANSFTTAQQGTALKNIGAAQFALLNGKIVESHASSAVTFAVKGLDGNDPSATNPVTVIFPDGTQRALTAALSVVVSSGSTLGAANATPFRLWLAIVDDAGTLRLAVRNCADANGVYGIPGIAAVSSTAEGGAGAADSAGVWYTGTAVTAKQFAVVCMADYESGLTTAGTWAASPTRVALYAPGMPLPGQIVRTTQTSNSSAFTTTANTYQTTNLTVTITPSSPINKVRVAATAVLDAESNAVNPSLQIHRGSTAIGAEVMNYSAANRLISPVGFAPWYDSPFTTSATTYAVKLKVFSGAGNVYCPASGLPSAGSIIAEEIMV